MGTQWIIGAAVALVLIYAVVVFNRLIRQRNVVREGWSGIDVQLRRRTDLVPNLVATVQAYAAHERGLLEDVSEKRAMSIAAGDVGGQAAAERALSGSLGRLLALAEAYPPLKADKNFLDLQDELSNVEDQTRGRAPLGAPPWRFWAGAALQDTGIASGSLRRCSSQPGRSARRAGSRATSRA
jgi:LemA protein